MRVIMFQPHFADLIAAGTKFQTIRVNARCRACSVLSLRRWEGKPYRSKHEVIREGYCESVMPVVIDQDSITLDGRKLMNEDGFAKADGFDDARSMREWFERVHGLPFTGAVIRWSNL